MKGILLAASLALVSLAASADIPSGYYNSINGKKEAALKTAVYEVIHNLTPISSYNDLPKYFQVTDVYPDGSKRWWDMYSDIPLYAPSFSGLNREHSFPKSWWGGSKNINAYTDLNHLYPSEMAANTAKSNYPLGTVDMTSKVQFDNGVTKVGYAVNGQGGGAKFVFEPADEYKGDFARTYFYMVTCYQNLTWAQQYMYMLQQNTYPTLNDWSINLLLKWSREDPVSQKEIDRNERVYGFQNNRNPFIDFPSLAEYIWGNKKGEIFYTTNAGEQPPTGEPNLISPVQDMALDFGEVAIGKSITTQLFFKGENITGDLSLSIYSGDKAMFSIPTSKIAANLVNSPDGYWLNVTYSPTAVGEHTSRLLISDGGMAGSRGIQLLGACREVPQLSPCEALPASDITNDSYVASWTTPDDVVDYYIVTRTKYSGGNATKEEVLAEDTSVLMEDFDQSESESYYVQSVRLGYYSDPSNVIFVAHDGITGVDAGQPLALNAIPGGVRIICSAPHTGCRVFDPAGRMILRLDQVDNNTDIDLPIGIYMLTTDQSPRPQKFAVRY